MEATVLKINVGEYALELKGCEHGDQQSGIRATTSPVVVAQAPRSRFQ
jgi:hypothetical protein